MANLFGLDIAGIVNDAITTAGGVLDGTLTKVTPGTRTPGTITGGTNPGTANHAFKGFLSNSTRIRRDNTLVEVSGEFLSILGASLPSGVVPEPTDIANIESTNYRLIELMDRDPAAALYTFRVES